MEHKVEENYKISGFFVFFLIHASQVGIGVLTFQTLIFSHTKNDAWISLLLAGISLHIIIWMIYKMLSKPTRDVIDLHCTIFGKHAGNFISLLLVFYFLIFSLAVFRGYIEVIQVWMFPTINTWSIALVFLLIIYYIVTGGFRVITGFCFFAVVSSSFLSVLLYFNAKHGYVQNLLPILNHPVGEIVLSSKFAIGVLFIGFETLLIYFPFLHSTGSSAKWAHSALVFTNIKYLALTVVTLMYFSQGLLEHTYWPVLVMIKALEFPLFSRFEFIFLSVWLIIVLPAIFLSLWSCTRIVKRVTGLKPTLSLPFIVTLMFFSTLLLDDRMKIEKFGRIVAELGIYFVFGYIPLLFVLFYLKSFRSR
ncbi:GerAB/ArcD/ProY family transporter [Paenibacillus gansuensis]|uniref:GerAB/ArcD/ProY family transporter n=1 Tax=Paenibacillus gansuensis TaxID=306542 RepID=A0ABW5PG64_9BACL